MQSPEETLEMLSEESADCFGENPEQQPIIAGLGKIPEVSIISPDEMAKKFRRDRKNTRRAEKRLEKIIHSFKK